MRNDSNAGANYRAACRARSRANFVSKIGIVEEELDETLYWFEVSLEAGFLSRIDADGLMHEGNELWLSLCDPSGPPRAAHDAWRSGGLRYLTSACHRCTVVPAQGLRMS